MENLIFFLLFLIYICAITLIYSIYFMGAFEFILPIMNWVIKDKETADGIFMVVFWFAAGFLLVILSILKIDNIVLWINSPWLTNICKDPLFL